MEIVPDTRLQTSVSQRVERWDKDLGEEKKY